MGVQARVGKNGNKSYGVKVSTNIDGYHKQVWVGTFDRKKDAEAAYVEAKRDMNTYGRLRRVQSVSVVSLMDKVVANKKSSGCAPNTVSHYQATAAIITGYFGKDTPLQGVTKEMTDAFVHYIYGKYKAGTVSGVMSFARSAFRSAVRWGYIVENPFDDIAVPRNSNPAKSTKRGSAFSREDIDRIVASAPDYMKNTYAVWPLIGLRISELRGLRWCDVDLDCKHIDVSNQLDERGKGLVPLKTTSSRRRIYLSDKAVALLTEQMDVSRCEYVFPSHTLDKPFTSSMNTTVRKHLKKAGMQGASPHTFRHTFGSWLLSAGAPFTYIQSQLGHSKLSTTMNVYLHEIDGQRFDPNRIDA